MIEFKQKRVFGEIFNDTFAFIRENLAALGQVAIRILLPLFALLNLALIYLTNQWQASILNVSLKPNVSPELALRGVMNFYTSMFNNGWFLGVALASLLIGTFVGGVFYMFIRHYIRGESLAPDAIWVSFRQEIGMLLATSIGSSLLGVLFILLTAVVNVIPCLGQLAWLSFALFVLVMMSIIFPVRIMEPQWRFFEAVERSRKLLKGHWWQSVGIMLILGLVVIAMNLLFAMPLQIYLWSLGAMLTPHKLTGLAQVGLYIFQFLEGMSQILSILPILAFFFQYHNLVEHKEGAGLESRIDKI